MPYAIVVVPVAPLRATAAHRSEMISQLLWGEGVEIINTAPDGWVEVINQYDGYSGWASLSHLEEVSEDIYHAPATHYLPEWSNEILLNGQPMILPFGCLLKGYTNLSAKWGNVQVTLLEKPHVLPAAGSPVNTKHLLADAMKFLNTAYLWGGRNVFGVDCSGFVQNVFKLSGIPLLRDASQQATQGTTVDFLQEARLGDLAFFDNPEGRITHVGLLLNDHEILHSSGKVRIDPIDNQGIINADTHIRTHQLRIIKRFF
nr:C40 family peptidase [uncultured Chitinophaga sp.]